MLKLRASSGSSLYISLSLSLSLSPEDSCVFDGSLICIDEIARLVDDIRLGGFFFQLEMMIYLCRTIWQFPGIWSPLFSTLFVQTRDETFSMEVLKFAKCLWEYNCFLSLI